MSENNKRTVEQIQQQYSQVCARLGHTEYQLHLLSRDSEALKNELETLNIEAATVAASAKKEEVAPASVEAAAPSA